MHLFVSFILKAIAVFIKDVVLYEVGEVDNCSSGSVSNLFKTLSAPVGVVERALAFHGAGWPDVLEFERRQSW